MSKKQLGFDFGKSRGKGCADTLGSGPTPKPGEQVHCAQFMSGATLRREFASSKDSYRHAVVSAKSKSGPRAVRGWFATKAAAYSAAEKLKKTDHQVGP